jgi:hypothetical protein
MIGEKSSTEKMINKKRFVAFVIVFVSIESSKSLTIANEKAEIVTGVGNKQVDYVRHAANVATSTIGSIRWEKSTVEEAKTEEKIEELIGVFKKHWQNYENEIKCIKKMFENLANRKIELLPSMVKKYKGKEDERENQKHIKQMEEIKQEAFKSIDESICSQLKNYERYIIEL